MLGPFDAYLVMLGIETLSERIDKQTKNTERVLEYLEASPDVEWVRHPRAAKSPCRELARKYLPRGAGSVLSFGFAGSEAQMRSFIEATELFSYHPNIGDAKSLIINPAQTTHIELTPEQREKTGLADNTVRLSIGLEDADDLIADLAQAFAKSLS
jgi:O-acetylhomoserine (thiol)-lyase